MRRKGGQVKDFFSSLPTYKFDKDVGEWKEIDFSAPLSLDATVSQLRVVAYNVLFNINHADQIYTKERHDKIHSILESLDADIIGLCEVQQSHLLKLLRSEFIQNNYYISDNQMGTNVGHGYGQVLLSKYPFSLSVRAFSAMKKVIAGTFSFNGTKFHVPVVHLTSDHSNNASIKRVAQIHSIYEKFAPEDSGDDCVIIGDYNIGDGDPTEVEVFRHDFIDSWLLLHPRDPGFTFDPATNSLAKLMGLSGKSFRYDRIIGRFPRKNWVPRQCSRIGTESFIHPNLPEVTLFPSDHYGIETVFEYVTGPRGSDVSVSAPSSSSVSMPPTLVGVEDEHPIENPTKSRIIESLANFDLSASISETLLPELPKNSDPYVQALHTVKDVVALILKETPHELHPIGSYAIGTSAVGSDIDCVALGRFPVKDFFKRARTVLVTRPSGVQLIRHISDALVPLLKLTYNGIHIDLMYCYYPGENLDKGYKHKFTDAELRRLDNQSQLVFSGIIDTNLLQEFITERSLFSMFVNVGLNWTAKGIYNSRLGYLGGFGWTIMCAYIYGVNSKPTLAMLVSSFFEIYSSWDWSKSIGYTSQVARQYKRSPLEKLVVLTAAKPYRNIARNATRSSHLSIVQHIRDTYNSLLGGTVEALFSPFQITAQYPSYLKLSIGAMTAKEFTVWSSFIESRLVSLLVSIEALSPSICAVPAVEQYEDPSGGLPFSCCYLVGIEFISKEGEDSAKKPAINISTVVSQFELQLSQFRAKTSTMLAYIRQIKREKAIALNVWTPPELEEEETVDEQDEDEADGNEDSSSLATPVTSGGNKQMGTSEQVYNRIKWDPKLDKDTFLIGYYDRFTGIKESTYDDFRRVDFVPWHRVKYFKRGNQIVWDREDRINILD